MGKVIKKDDAQEVGDGTGKRKERTYKSEMPASVSLAAGTEVEGTFQGAKQASILDKRTKEEKDVMVYTFRDEKGAKFAVLGRTQLDSAFEAVFEAEGGAERCQGLQMRIVRGEDVRLSGGRTMGTYEVSVWEA